MNILDLLQSEWFLSVVAALAAAGWSVARGWRIFAWLKDRRVQVALLCLEVALREVYESYVHDLKATSVDGKLHNGQRKNAREMAIERARTLAASKGVSLDETLGPDFLDAWLERVLKNVRSKK